MEKLYLSSLFGVGDLRRYAHQIVSINLPARRFSSAVTNCALYTMDVAAMILSAGSLFISKFTESSAISGEID